MASGDGLVAERDEQVTLAGARRSHQTEILLSGDPLQAREVVKRGAGNRAGRHVELLEGLGDREVSQLESLRSVARVARRDLGFEQRAQEILGAPALGLGRDEQLRREFTHCLQSQPSQRRVEVARQWCERGAHDSVPVA